MQQPSWRPTSGGPLSDIRGRRSEHETIWRLVGIISGLDTFRMAPESSTAEVPRRNFGPVRFTLYTPLIDSGLNVRISPTSLYTFCHNSQSYRLPGAVIVLSCVSLHVMLDHATPERFSLLVSLSPHLNRIKSPRFMWEGPLAIPHSIQTCRPPPVSPPRQKGMPIHDIQPVDRATITSGSATTSN